MAPAGMAGIPANGVGSLSTLLKRLEAATSRLEDIAVAQQTAQAVPGATSPVSSASAIQPSNAALTGLGVGAVGGAAVGAAAASAAPVAELPPSVTAFEELRKGAVAHFVGLSNELGGLISEQSEHLSAAFAAQQEYLAMAAACTKLAQTSPAFATALGPTQKALMAAVDLKDRNRPSKDFNGLTMVAEGIPALGWVTLESKPGPYVTEMKDAAQFYGNRVIKDNKDSNPKAVEWVRAFAAMLDALKAYIMQFHTTGITWNPKGVDPATYKPAGAATVAAAAPAAGGAPPPPPPPPPPAPPAAPPAPAAPAVGAAAPAGDMAGVFAELNKGEAITAGLKKVDKSQMTHKNPELRGTSVVPSSTAKGAPAKPAKPSSMQKKPAKTELDGKTWNVENHDGNSAIVLDQTELNQVVNIFNVNKSVVQVKGKVNAINLVNCTKTSILLDSLVSALSLSNSPSFTVQILGAVPTILIDGTDGGQVYLSKESLGVEIVTAKSSAINISIPDEKAEEGEFVERAVPEQFKTVVKDGKLVTIVVEHSG